MKNGISENSVKLEIKGNDVYFDLSFLEVLEVRCVDFCKQNVILELISTFWQEIEKDELRGNVRWIYSRDGGEVLLSQEKIEKIAKDVMERKYHLFMMVPSWGAQVGVLAKDVVFHKK